MKAKTKKEIAFLELLKIIMEIMEEDDDDIIENT